MLDTKKRAMSGAAGGREPCWQSFGQVVTLLGLAMLLAGCTPSGPRALIEGQRLIAKGRYQQAIEKLRAATALLGGTNAQAWNDLGLAYHHAGEAAEAQKAYLRALALDHDLSEARFNLGCLDLAQNKAEEAKAEFTAYTLRRPNVAEGFLKLGAAQLRTREPSAAERSFSEALRLDPKSPEALNGLGLARLGRGRANEAARCFQAALKQQANYGPALLNLAIVAHQYLRDRPLALQKYRECLALKPPPASADVLLANVRQLEQELTPPPRHATASPPAQPAPVAPTPKSAGANATRVTSTPKPEPAPTTPKRTVANAPKPAPTNVPKPVPAKRATEPVKVEAVKVSPAPVLKQGQEVALAAPRLPSGEVTPGPSRPRVAAREPEPPKRSFFQRINPLNLFRRAPKEPLRPTPLGAESGAPANQPPKVSAAAAEPPPSRPVEPAPSEPPSRYAYKSPARPAAGDRSAAERAFAQGVQAYQVHRLQEAIQAYRAAAQLDPNLFEAQYNLGVAATQAGNLPLALTAYETALTLRPDSLDARYNFALVLKQANHPVDAVNELERIVRSSPNETRAHVALGNLYAQQLRQPAKARQHYLKVLELAPQHPQAGAIGFWLAANPP